MNVNHVTEINNKINYMSTLINLTLPLSLAASGVQWVDALCHKMGDPCFDSQWGPWKLSSDLIILSAFSSLGVHSASNRNEYQGTSSKVKYSQ
jgi:hypothetical protein